MHSVLGYRFVLTFILTLSWGQAALAQPVRPTVDVILLHEEIEVGDQEQAALIQVRGAPELERLCLLANHPAHRNNDAQGQPNDFAGYFCATPLVGNFEQTRSYGNQHAVLQNPGFENTIGQGNIDPEVQSFLFRWTYQSMERSQLDNTLSVLAKWDGGQTSWVRTDTTFDLTVPDTLRPTTYQSLTLSQNPNTQVMTANVRIDTGNPDPQHLQDVRIFCNHPRYAVTGNVPACYLRYHHEHGFHAYPTPQSYGNQCLELLEDQSEVIADAQGVNFLFRWRYINDDCVQNDNTIASLFLQHNVTGNVVETRSSGWIGPDPDFSPFDILPQPIDLPLACTQSPAAWQCDTDLDNNEDHADRSEANPTAKTVVSYDICTLSQDLLYGALHNQPGASHVDIAPAMDQLDILLQNNNMTDSVPPLATLSLDALGTTRDFLCQDSDCDGIRDIAIYGPNLYLQSGNSGRYGDNCPTLYNPLQASADCTGLPEPGDLIVPAYPPLEGDPIDEGCTSNNDCGGSTPICNISNGLCEPFQQAGCDSDSQCPAQTPICNTSNGQCEEAPDTGCASDNDCDGLTPICNTGNGQCEAEEPPPTSDTTVYYIDPQGGSYEQCNGLTANAYPGSGLGRNCAWSHPFVAFPPGSTQARIEGGDIVEIAPGDYRMGLGAPDPQGVCSSYYPWDCVMGRIPSGTSSKPTILRGAGYDDPNSPRPTLIAVERALHVLNLTNVDHVRVQHLEITDGANCLAYHPRPEYRCERNNYPYGDWGNIGVQATDSEFVTFEDVDVHGFSNSGFHVGRVGNWFLSDVRIAGNGLAGWDGDVVGDDNNWGTLLFDHVEIVWNGCILNPATGQPMDNSCVEQNAGFYGDGLGTNTTGGSWIFRDSKVAYNTSDGIDLLYLNDNGQVSMDRSVVGWNAGNQVKLHGNASITNSVLVGACAFFANSNLTWGGSFNHCRAYGSTLALDMNGGQTARLINNTIYSQGDCLVAGEGQGTVYSRNNVFQADTDYLQPYENTCLFYSDSQVSFDNDYSAVGTIKDESGWGCHFDPDGPTGPHNICADPGLSPGIDVDDLSSLMPNVSSPFLLQGLQDGSGSLIPNADINGISRQHPDGVDCGAFEMPR